MTEGKKIEGWDSGYRYGQDPEIDGLVERLNEIILPHGEGGIALAAMPRMDGAAETAGVLELPEGIPAKTKEEAENLARQIGEKMAEKRSRYDRR